MKRIASLALLAAVTSSIATAQYSDWSCNADGAVHTQPDGTKLYFGKSCDAARSDGAEGHWWYADPFLRSAFRAKACSALNTICRVRCPTASRQSFRRLFLRPGIQRRDLIQIDQRPRQTFVAKDPFAGTGVIPHVVIGPLPHHQNAQHL